MHAVNADLGHGAFRVFGYSQDCVVFARSNFVAFFAVQTAGSQSTIFQSSSSYIVTSTLPSLLSHLGSESMEADVEKDVEDSHKHLHS
jgi:hypothetical protein